MNDPRIEFVVREARGLVAPDGGDLSLMGVADGVVRVRYSKPADASCPSCVLTASDLAEFLRDMFARSAVTVEDVVVVES